MGKVMLDYVWFGLVVGGQALLQGKDWAGRGKQAGFGEFWGGNYFWVDGPPRWIGRRTTIGRGVLLR